MSGPFDLAPTSLRLNRESRLLFGWRAGDGSLDAYTGQPGEIRAYGSASDTGFTITGRLGNSITAGTTQPRWEQDPAEGTVTRLTLEDGVSGKVGQSLVFPFAANVQPVSIFVRCYPLYTIAQNVAAGGGPGGILLMLGNGPGTGNAMIVSRLGTNWIIRRIVPTTSVDVTVAEVSGQVHPTDVLATISATGGMQIQTRDAAGVTRTGTLSGTNAPLMVTTQSWGLPQLTFGSALTDYTGGRYQYETVKVARGVLTFAQMDLLS